MPRKTRPMVHVPAARVKAGPEPSNPPDAVPATQLDADVRLLLQATHELLARDKITNERLVVANRMAAARAQAVNEQLDEHSTHLFASETAWRRLRASVVAMWIIGALALVAAMIGYVVLPH